jgi:hypothetical protein
MRDDFRQQGGQEEEEEDEEEEGEDAADADDSSRRQQGSKPNKQRRPTDTVATIEKIKSNWLKDALRPPTTTAIDADVDVWNGKNKVPAWYQSVSLAAPHPHPTLPTHTPHFLLSVRRANVVLC